MDALAGLTFRWPQVLAALLLIPVMVAGHLRSEAARRSLSDRFISERLRGVFNHIRQSRPWFLGGAFVAAVIALAGPQLGETILEVTTMESTRVLVLDVSRSMSAEDVGTSRLAAATALSRRLLAEHQGRVGLIVFEKTAEVIAPLTTDIDAVATLLGSLQTGEVGTPGSNLGAGIEAALELAVPGNESFDVILISDGEEQGGAEQATARARRARVRISTIVIGTESGATIPAAAEGGKFRDESGSIVVTRARSEMMRRVARQTGGVGLVNPFSEDALRPLISPKTGAGSKAEVLQPVERYQWPLVLAFVLFLSGSFAHRGAE